MTRRIRREALAVSECLLESVAVGLLPVNDGGESSAHVGFRGERSKPVKTISSLTKYDLEVIKIGMRADQ